jgi:hypothetical protein
MSDDRTPPQTPLPAPPPELRSFIDDQGRLRQWPAKFSKQLVAFEWMSHLFERGRDYTEPEVNEILNAAHTFGDWAILRRGLCDHRYLERDSNGARYRRMEREED